VVEPERALPRAEYVADVPYPRNFVPQLAPSTLRLVAALGGRGAPPGDDFDYCELGAGRGDTLVTLAAANPEARFVGVDLGTDHVAFARGLAERGEVGNVRLYQRDFEDPALPAELPDFDYVVAHGVLSWVSPQKRAAVFRFAQAKLKPGGLLFASYNALPGWAAVAPLRRILLDHAATATGSTLDRARASYAFACRLAAAKAGYFASHPTAQRMLDVMKESGLAYVVHEYFHAHWHPLYFADAAREAGEHDLSFVGQTPLYLNVPELALPPAIKDLAAALPDPLARESLKDVAMNELFRSDVYARGPRHTDPGETRRFFEGTRFGALTVASQLRREVRLPVYTLDFKGRVYDAILPPLCEAPATAAELARRPELAGLGADRIAQCLQNLCLGGQIVPMRPAVPSARAAGYRMPSAFNRGALDQGIAGEGPLALASPAIGTGLQISLVEAVFLRLLAGGDPSWIEGFARGRTFPLSLGDQRFDDAGKLVQWAARDQDRRREIMGPKLCQLGILEPRS
jgi:ubiquinone/menaquinone biosynthesis C-methylase UbiE